MNNRKKVIILICIILISSFVIYTVSKLFKKSTDVHIQSANKFYFESNELHDSNETVDTPFELYDWDPTTTYSFNINLRNYKDSKRYSDKDISYRVTAEIPEEYENLIELTSNSNDLTSTETLPPISRITYSDSNLNQIVPVNIQLSKKASATLPTDTKYVTFKISVKTLKQAGSNDSEYVKVLENNFKVNLKEEKALKATINDNGGYVNLFVNTNDNGNFSIKYDNTKLDFDTNNAIYVSGSNFINPTVTTSGVYTTVDLNLNSPNSNYEFGFIKLTADEIELGAGKDIEIIVNN